MVSTRGVRYKFTEGERVLCYEPDPTKAKVLYDSKVLEVIESKDKRGRRTVEYLIHFQGWNSSWDRCVSEDFVLKDTEENRQLQRDLAEKSQLQLGAYLYRRERKKGSTSSAGAGPAKRSRQGFSDDGSSSSTQPDEAEGEAEGSGRSRDTNDTDSSGSGAATTPPHAPGRAHIQIPGALRDRLTFDYHLVVKRGRLSKLPASPCAAQILESFVKWFARAGAWHPPRARADPPVKPDLLDVSCRLNLIREIADGIRVYFDFILRGHLLYKQEQKQYYQLCGQYIDEKETRIKEEYDTTQRSCTEGSEEEMTSPRMAEYSHLPPDPEPGLEIEHDDEGPDTPPGQNIEMHRIIIIKKEIKEEPDDQQEGIYQQSLVIQMDIKEEQDSQDNREYYSQENQVYYQQHDYQEYEYQCDENQAEQEYEDNQEEQDDDNQEQDDENQDQDDQDSENQEGDEQVYDNQDSETQDEPQEYENDDDDDEFGDQDDPEYEGEEDESSEEIEEEEEFEIELDEENYRNQMELRNQLLQDERNLQQEYEEGTAAISDEAQADIINEIEQQVTSNESRELDSSPAENLAEMELRSGKHIDLTQGGKEKYLQHDTSNTGGTHMTLRRGKQIASKEDDKQLDVIETVKQKQDTVSEESEKQIEDKQESGQQSFGKGSGKHSKQVDIKQTSSQQLEEKLIDPNQGSGKQVEGKQSSGKHIHSKRKSGKQLDDETEKETNVASLVVEQEQSEKQIDVSTIETRSAGKRRSGKQIDALQEDDKPLSDIQSSFKQEKERQLEAKRDSVEHTHHKHTSGKGGKGKHLDTKHVDKHDPKNLPEKRTGKGKQIDLIQEEEDEQTVTKISGEKGKHVATKQVEKDIENPTGGKHMTLRQGSGKQSPSIEKREGKKIVETLAEKHIEGKKGKHGSSSKHIAPTKGRGKQIFELPEDDNEVLEISKNVSRGGKEMTLRSKGKEMKQKSGKYIETQQTEDKPSDEKHSEGKSSGKQVDTKHSGGKEIKAKESIGKHLLGKQTTGKKIDLIDEKLDTSEKQTETKRTGAKETTLKTTGKHIEDKEINEKQTDEKASGKQIEEGAMGSKQIEVKETEEKHKDTKQVSRKQIEVKESEEKQTELSETAEKQVITKEKTKHSGKHIEFDENVKIKQEIESQDEDVEEDREHERRSARKRSGKHLDTQDRSGKKRLRTGKSMSETEDKSEIKQEVPEETTAIKLEIKEERDDSNEKPERLSPLEEPMDQAGDVRSRVHARRSQARRLRSNKSGVSQSENEEPLPSTSGTEPRAFEAVSSSVCSSGSSVSEGWRAPPAAAPAPPTRTPLSLLLEKVAKWQIIPREGTEHLPCRVYGAIHLARLFVKLPEFLNATQMPDLKLKLILKHIDMFVQFLDEHSEWFGEQYYYADNFARES